MKRNANLDTTFELSVQVPSVKNSTEKHKEARPKGNKWLRKKSQAKFGSLKVKGQLSWNCDLFHPYHSLLQLL